MLDKIIYISGEGGRQVLPHGMFWRTIRRFERVVTANWFNKLVEFLSAVTEPVSWARVLSEPQKQCVQECGEISVLSANLWHDFPKFRNLKERMENFVHLVQEVDPDVVLLQEVTRTPTFKTDEWLAESLGMAYVYSRANGNDRLGFEEGIGVYSKFPLGMPILKQFRSGTSPLTRRLALGAPIETPCGDMLVFSVHLSLTPFLNRKQVPQVQEWIAKVAAGRTSLVGGDFNTFESTAAIRRICARWIDTFRHLHPFADGSTHESRWPWGSTWRKRLDYIFLTPGNLSWSVVDTRVLDNQFGLHSDHRAILTRLSPASRRITG